MNRIQGICFDLDGTLGGYVGDFGSLLSLARTELMLQACDMNAFAALMREELAKDGALDLRSVLVAVLGRLEQREPPDLDVVVERVVEAYAAGIRPAPGAAELLTRLSSSGVKLALASNGPVDMQRAALRSLGFERHFRAVLISGDRDVAARKPAGRIFSLACTGLETLPSETLMVGDNPDADIAGALAFGMQAVLIGSEQAGRAAGVPAVGGLVPLATLLKSRYGL